MIWNKAVAKLNTLRAQYINAFPYRRVIEVSIPELIVNRINLISFYFVSSGCSGGFTYECYHLPLQHVVILVPVRLSVSLRRMMIM